MTSTDDVLPMLSTEHWPIPPRGGAGRYQADMEWQTYNPQLFEQDSTSDSSSSGTATPTGPRAPSENDHSNAEAAATGPPSESPGSRLMNAAVDLLLKNQPSPNPLATDSEQRQMADEDAMERLDQIHTTGDTVVIVNFPESSAETYYKCNHNVWRSTAFRVPSEAMLGTGSSFFAKLYSDRAQARIRRRIDPTKYGTDVKFVLDLTPSSEGDELAAQLAELSIPPGVRDWWMNCKRLGISRFLVSGHDDNCPRHLAVPLEYDLKPGPGQSIQSVGTDPSLPTDDLDDIEPSETRMIPDYCPVRHRANIIRLIRTILGEDLVLNSAARVYTISGIAKQLDCAGVICDAVFTWFMAQPNTDFIDIEPEASLRIGWNLRLRDITRAAMRVLVAERTVDALSTAVPTNTTRQRTILGRPRSELPDELENIIQHAAAKFSERLQQIDGILTSPQIFKFLDVTEVIDFMAVGELVSPGQDIMAGIFDAAWKIRHPISASASADMVQESFRHVCKALLKYVSDAIREAESLDNRSNGEPKIERDRLCYTPRSSFSSYLRVWSSTSPIQRRVFTKFWNKFDEAIGSWSDFETSRLSLINCAKIFNQCVELAASCGTIEGLRGSEYQLNLRMLHSQLSWGFRPLRSTWAYPPDLEIPLNRSAHLILGLTDEEFKYLPLWAGGLDDGTGGVFQEEVVPDADMGPIGPGPAYHTGYSVMTETDGTLTIAPSDAPTISVMDTDDMDFDTATLTSGRSRIAMPTGSTVTASRAASSYAPSSVLTPSEGGSVVSAMARDVRTMRLSSVSTDHAMNLSNDGRINNNNNSDTENNHTSNPVATSADDVEMTIMDVVVPIDSASKEVNAQAGNSSNNHDENNGGDGFEVMYDDDDWSAPSDDDDDDLQNFM